MVLLPLLIPLTLKLQPINSYLSQGRRQRKMSGGTKRKIETLTIVAFIAFFASLSCFAIRSSVNKP